MSSFIVRTAKHELKINYIFQFFKISDVKIDKKLFNELCKSGCKNYSKKYSCPPYAPDFKNEINDNDLIFVLMFHTDLKQLDNTDYRSWHKLLLLNRVMKPRIEKIMRQLEQISKTRFLATGSCRLCNPCQLKLKKPCKYPEKRRYSLESMGVDCNALSKKLNKPLQWLSKEKTPEYTAVICGLPLKAKAKNQVLDEFQDIIRKL